MIGIGKTISFALQHLLREARTSHASPQGKFAQAQTTVAGAVADHPASAKARLQLARLLYQRGELQAAAEHLKETVKLDSTSGAHLQLGKAYEQLGRHDQAQRHLTMREPLGLH